MEQVLRLLIHTVSLFIFCLFTGKTFVYNTLIAELKARGEEVQSTASTGVAATLLLTGRTAHRAFCIPLGCDATDVPSIAAHSALAARLRNAKAIIIDEMTMINKDTLNFIDRTLRSLYSGAEKDLPFAGKLICISGDWKQRLPIVNNAQRPAIVASTVKNSDSYHLFETLTLTENMRVDPNEVAWKDWCRDVGNGMNYIAAGSELIHIPDELLLDPDNQEAIFDFAFPPHLFTDIIASKPKDLAIIELLSHIFRVCSDGSELSKGAILAYTNAIVDRLNATLMDRLPGDTFTSLSIDKPLNTSHLPELDVHQAELNLEFFHAKTPGNMPPHELRLKKGTPVILTTNIDVQSGLVNGTRLQLLEMINTSRTADGPTFPIAKCRVLNGKSTGKQILLIPTRFQHGLERNSMETPFERLQLPIKPAFAMTVDKAQGKFEFQFFLIALHPSHLRPDAREDGPPREGERRVDPWPSLCPDLSRATSEWMPNRPPSNRSGEEPPS